MELDSPFDESPFFTNKVLTKEYFLRDVPDPESPLLYDGPEIIGCKGCFIAWNEGMDVTVSIQSDALIMPKEEVEEEFAKGEKDMESLEILDREEVEEEFAKGMKDVESLEMLDRVSTLPSYKISVYFGFVTLELIKVIKSFINTFF